MELYSENMLNHNLLAKITGIPT